MAGTTVNPYRFGGQVGYRKDSASTQYVRARHLDTSKGRWASRDPIGFGGGDGNLYRYVGNNAVNAIDPAGLADLPCVARFRAACSSVCIAQGKDVERCWKTCYDIPCVASFCINHCKCKNRPHWQLCSASEIGKREHVVDILCHNSRGCKGNEDCNVLEARVAVWSACLAARIRVQACYTPASPRWKTHQQAIRNAAEAIKNCTDDILHHRPPC